MFNFFRQGAKMCVVCPSVRPFVRSLVCSVTRTRLNQSMRFFACKFLMCSDCAPLYTFFWLDHNYRLYSLICIIWHQQHRLLHTADSVLNLSTATARPAATPIEYQGHGAPARRHRRIFRICSVWVDAGAWTEDACGASVAGRTGRTCQWTCTPVPKSARPSLVWTQPSCGCISIFCAKAPPAPNNNIYYHSLILKQI